MKTKKKPDLIDLAAGCYVLDDDVTNPRPDKRVTRNWTCSPVWKKGTRLYVRSNRYPDNENVVSRAIECIDERWTHMNVHRGWSDADRWNALAAHMRPVLEDLDFLLHRRDIGGYSRAEVLRVLLEWRRITLADIEAAYETAMRESDEAPTKAAVEDNS
jgi:hypothetical protein